MLPLQFSLRSSFFTYLEYTIMRTNYKLFQIYSNYFNGIIACSSGSQSVFRGKSRVSRNKLKGYVNTESSNCNKQYS